MVAVGWILHGAACVHAAGLFRYRSNDDRTIAPGRSGTSGCSATGRGPATGSGGDGAVACRRLTAGLCSPPSPRCPRNPGGGSTRPLRRWRWSSSTRASRCLTADESGAVTMDLPVPLGDGRGVPCLLLVERTPTSRTAPRQPLAHTIVQSTYRRGNQRIANPKHEELRRTIRALDEKDDDIIATGDPTIDLIGIVAGGILNGIGSIWRGRAEAEARAELADDPGLAGRDGVGALHLPGHHARGRAHRRAPRGPGGSPARAQLAAGADGSRAPPLQGRHRPRAQGPGPAGRSGGRSW